MAAHNLTPGQLLYITKLDAAPCNAYAVVDRVDFYATMRTIEGKTPNGYSEGYLLGDSGDTWRVVDYSVLSKEGRRKLMVFRLTGELPDV